MTPTTGTVTLGRAGRRVTAEAAVVVVAVVPVTVARGPPGAAGAVGWTADEAPAAGVAARCGRGEIFSAERRTAGVAARAPLGGMTAAACATSTRLDSVSTATPL